MSGEGPLTDELATPEQLLEFIYQASKLLQGLDGFEGNVFNTPENLVLCEYFVKSTSSETLYLLKVIDNSSIDDGSYKFLILSDLKASESFISVIALIKSNDPITSNKPFNSQLNLLNIPSNKANYIGGIKSSSFEVIRSLINLGISPYFELISAQQNSLDSSPLEDENESTSVALARKKFNELSLTLQHLQQQINIPDLLSTTHLVIEKTLIQFESDPNTSITTPIDLFSEEQLNDTTFLNQLTTIANNWVKQIQSITSLNHSPLDGSTIEEIIFWKSMDESLSSLTVQLSSNQVQTTLNILKRAKRYHVTMSFANEIGLEEKVKEANNYNSLLRELPIEEVLSISSNLANSDTLQKFEDSISIVFNHLKKLKNFNNYPLSRSIELTEAILLDISRKFTEILSNLFLMSLPLEKFVSLYEKSILKVFQNIDMNVKSMVNLIRELLRKRQEKFIAIRIDQTDILQLKDRLNYILKFRTRHNGLLLTVDNIINKEEVSQRLIDAYNQYIVSINIVDLSKTGNNIWSLNESLYQAAFDEVKSLVVTQVNSLLDSCHNFNDYLAIFNTFMSTSINSKENNSDRLLLLISDEQKLKCLAIVDLEIQNIVSLNRKKTAPVNSIEQFYRIHSWGLQTQLKSDNIPYVLSKILWMRSLRNLLEYYKSNLDNFFGSHWDQYSIGNKIQTEVTNLLMVSDPNKVFEDWVELTLKACPNFEIMGPVLRITSTEKAGSEILALEVNFDYSLIEFSDQLRQLSTLGFKIPSKASNQVNKVDKVYPFVSDLTEHVGILKDVVGQHSINSNHCQTYGFLLDKHRLKLFNSLKGCLEINWNTLSQAIDLQQITDSEDIDSQLKSKDLSNLVESKSLLLLKSFMEDVYNLYSKTAALRKFGESFDQFLLQLKNCKFTNVDIQSCMLSIQDMVTQFCYGDFLDIPRFYDLVNSSIETVLVEKCTRELDHIREVFSSTLPLIEIPSILKRETVTIVFQDQTFSLSPPLENCKKHWFQTINEVLFIVCGQNLIRYENENSFNHIAEIVSECISLCYDAIETVMMSGQNYFESWKNLQRFWELSLDEITTSLDNDMTMWISKIKEIREARTIFDTTVSSKSWGGGSNGILEMDYSYVQSRISSRYDSWQNEVFARFSDILSIKIRETEALLSKAILSLEDVLDFGVNLKLISLIVTNNSYMEKIEDWTSDISTYLEAQTLLQKLRFKLPNDWLFVEQLESNLSAIKDITLKKKATILEHLDMLSPRMTSESKKLDSQMKELQDLWEVKRPISGNLAPSNAISILHEFSDSCERVSNERIALTNACTILSINVLSFYDVYEITEEIKDLLNVWMSLDVLWNELSTLKELSWSKTSPRTLRRNLDDILMSARSLPSTTRQYSAFDTVHELIKKYIRNHSIITDLMSEAMKPRHWKSLFSQLHTSSRDMKEMTIGYVWDIDLNLNEQVVKSVLNQAHMEQTLEENLETIKKTWSAISFDMFNFKNKRRLIRGWDKLFDQCNNDIAALSNMHNSVYYSNFEKEATELENKLNKLYVLLDSWVEVQREWVYLDGVFGSSADITNLLPIESNRFNNITHEYFLLLRNAQKYPLVIDVLTLPNIQQTIDKTLESLHRVRKSLSEYLERQRELFPRFYFLGNEDLLQIVGSGNDMSQISQHLRKMFPGVLSLQYEVESSSVVGVNGDFGEEILLGNPISLIHFSRLHEWLKELEMEIRSTLSHLVGNAIEKLQNIWKSMCTQEMMDFINAYPAQIVVLAFQVEFTSKVEDCIGRKSYSDIYQWFVDALRIVADIINSDISPIQRKKLESLTIELLHQRDVISSLTKEGISESEIKFLWQTQQLFYYNKSEEDPLIRLVVKQANVQFTYGFEYLGITDKLAYTPLTNRCFLSMTQALGQGLGGSPFGPAGTGKTESVKALGHNLGKMVIVFCCDESFDFQSIGRIFLGLCKVGAWGCFDEFNRLDKNILSAVSSQIESIELGLSTTSRKVELSGKNITVHSDTGIFITMNPGYAGRSELPENLKRLFRSISMEKPDSEVIVEVLLTSSGFVHAQQLASVIVPFFSDINSQTSEQIHYDFGLRALKSTLVRCGAIKRSQTEGEYEELKMSETKIVLRSIHETIFPKLIKDDESVVHKLIEEHFKGVSYESGDLVLVEQLRKYGKSRKYTTTDSWIEKALQLNRIQNSNHGIMLVGAAGCGKSVIWKLLLDVLLEVDEKENISYVIDCKVMLKDEIYGTLDIVTREWVDGLFTSILRKITSNLRGEISKRIWIVFDGDIDPEWAENLNSVLDDNKILTLPNGERIALPENVRLIFEVDSLKYTTPATVSRCGMVWIDEDIVNLDSLFQYAIDNLADTQLNQPESQISDTKVLSIFVSEVESILSPGTLRVIFDKSQLLSHIMEINLHRYLGTFSTILRTYYRKYSKYVSDSQDLSNFKLYVSKSVLLSLVWAFAGDSKLSERENFGTFIAELPCFGSMDKLSEGSYIDYDVKMEDGSWENWLLNVNEISLEPRHISESGVVVPTLDTVRHESLIYSMLNEHRPFVLCGPPGSGKTMILLEALRKSPDLDILSLNFSKDTTPDLLMKSLEQFCEYKKLSTGLTLAPKVNDKWVVVFCDEINLPGVDAYGTQRVISLLRQMIEQGGFWRVLDKQWVTLSNILFVGACNPPTDPGRNVLSSRFLRHASVILVDYPGSISLTQIYNTFNLAVMKCAPDLRGFTQAVTDSMIEVYTRTRERLTPTIEQHYVYSPRELTRWSKGLLEAMKSHQYSNMQELVRLWYHEGLRLFYDRLVGEEERKWTIDLFATTISLFFPHIDPVMAMQQPVFFSNWLSLDYEHTDRSDLVSFVSERFRVFSEEEIDVDLILYDEMLDHALRIDRVLRQPQGHMILVGSSTSGKSTLTRFVAWINGLRVIQLNVHRGYTLVDFDSSLRSILLRCAKGERICFMIDESSVLETSFIERMNTLLANAEIPGLFEGDDYNSLLKLCQEESNVQGLYLDTHQELYKWFTNQIATNLHVVFTLSETKAATTPRVTTSPALFNRCVLNWMGDWSNKSLFDIASTIVCNVPLDVSHYVVPPTFESEFDVQISDLRSVITECLVFIHRYEVKANDQLLPTDPLPSWFIKFVKGFVKIYSSKLYESEENQRHINIGLDKLKETMLQVNELKIELSKKKEYLIGKDNEAKVMLNRMLVDQNEAERKQEFSIETQLELSKQKVEIERRQKIVMKDLELAEPQVLEAQRGVQNIKKQHLTEIRSMSNPPSAVKMTMESVCVLIGYQVSTWRDVQLIVRRDDFIANIVSFDNEVQLTPELRNYMEETYLAREDYNFEAVNRASKACGPLMQWVQAQVSYSEILENIGPLREKVLILELKTTKTKAQLIAIDEMINELKESIETYKEAYSSLIRDAENVKLDMRKVSSKVDRSLQLIDNLTSERERWGSSIKKFSKERELLVGDSILASAFLTYGGVHDQKRRDLLFKAWRTHLTSCGISFDRNFNICTYLTSANDVMEWEANETKLDDLFLENFVLIKSAHIPLIIDPTAQAIEVLRNNYDTKKLIISSFLDSNFSQQLENALRFGGHILIQDAEYFDPILNTVLRGETYKNGGRTVVKLKEQEIDFSPDFKLFLHTRDSLVKVSSFLSGRTAIVNFTVTSASLENQVLNISLAQKRPDIEVKRRELTELQGKYKVRLFTLEEELLSSLSTSSGNILEDDSVLGTLESLKAESSDIDSKMDEANDVMNVVEEVRNEYFHLSKHASQIFSIIKTFLRLDRFYNFSLNAFTDVFTKVITADVSNTIEFVLMLYKETFSRFSLSLKHAHVVTFALSLFSLYHSLEGSDTFKVSFSNVLKSIGGGVQGDSILKVLEINGILGYEKQLFEISDIESICLANSQSTTLNLLSNFLKGIVDGSRLSEIYVESTSFLYTGLGEYSSKFDMNTLIKEQNTASKPVIIVSPEFLDPTFKIQQLAELQSQHLSTISMGSKEGTDIATKEIQVAATRGSWVLIQNVHMSLNWLSQLQKILDLTKFHQGFKIFLTCTTTSNIPSILISKSQIFMFEDQPGLRTRFKDLLDSIPPHTLKKNPGERRRIYFLLIWFHSMLQERLKYVPISFATNYDITISDFKAACFVIDKALDSLGTMRTNISPSSLPWEYLRYLIANITYGGKIDHVDDLNYVISLSQTVFNANAFNLEFNLIENEFTKSTATTLYPPEGDLIEGYIEWAEHLPDNVPLNWIGLDNKVDNQVRERNCRQIATDTDLIITLT